MRFAAKLHAINVLSCFDPDNLLGRILCIFFSLNFWIFSKATCDTSLVVCVCLFLVESSVASFDSLRYERD